jgi:hypothetical protein
MPARASDSRSLLLDVAGRLRTATIDALWRQWSTLGASAAGTVAARAVIDPEAVVLASLCLVDDEPRLDDVVAQWSLVNGELLSVQRIKNLSAAYPDVTTRLAEFARLMSDEGSDARWRSLVRTETPALSYRAGRSRSVRVAFARPPCLLLRVRVLLGVGVKADAVAFLLSHKRPNGYVDPTDIARIIAYDVASVRRVLSALAEAGWLHRVSDPSTGFSTDESSLGRLLGVAYAEIPEWRYCAGLYAMVVDLLALTAALPASATDYALDVVLEEFETKHRLVFVDTGLLQAHRRAPPTDLSLDLLERAEDFIRNKV